MHGGTGLPWVRHDGGRAEAGFRGGAGDCVVRSIAIATGTPYREVYDELAKRMAATRPRRGGRRYPRSARNGVLRSVYDAYLAERGWIWQPTMNFGCGCTTHLRPGDLPERDRLIVRVSGHLTAVVDGIVYDTADPCRGGTRCVYGFYYRADPVRGRMR